jgi:hypothetical protein
VVGGGCDHRTAELPDDVARDLVARHADGDAVEAGGRKLRHGAAGALLQHQGQRTRPEFCGEALGGGVEHRKPLGRQQVGHMGDQRVERGTALGGVEAGDRLGVGRIRAEPVDRLGRKRHQPAGGKAGRGVGDGADLRRDQACRDFGRGVGVHVGWLMRARPE